MGRLATRLGGGFVGAANILAGRDVGLHFAGFRGGDRTRRFDLDIWRRAGRIRLVIRFALPLPGGVRTMCLPVAAARPAGGRGKFGAGPSESRTP